MAKKPRAKPAPKAQELSALEKELFLSAFYQGEVVPEKKHEKKKPEPVETFTPALDIDERDVFLEAVNQQTILWTPKDEDRFSGAARRVKQGKRRNLVDAKLDLHGMFAKDAVKALFRFLDREKQRGSRTVLIVHGKGEGVLREAVRSCLSTHPAVDDFLGAEAKLGGAGAILVRMNRKPPP
ncbi:MAG TPA: Smr/MutS family protein [Myxococcota bacterium]|nr:Smr/MutS family protein [Myxococcota bacterium]